MDEPAARSRSRTYVVAVALAVAALFVYASALDYSPVYLTKDEASYAIQAHAVATTGHDTNGRRFPVFFQENGFGIGRDPIYIYATAALLTFRPLAAGVLRIPTTTAAAVAIGMIALVADELYDNLAVAAATGLLLLVTPAFFIRGRAALSVILPVPFQLAWLWCLLRYARTRRLRDIAISTAALGVGVYSYLSMLFFAPIHLLFSLAEIARQKQWRHAAIVLAVFALLMVPLAAWQVAHPGHINDVASSYRMYPANLTPLQGIKDMLSWSSLSRRSDIYWSAFNPSRLFFSGESSLIDSTRYAGLYPTIYLLLLPIGFYQMLRRPWSITHVAVLSLISIGPVPGVLINEETIARYLIVSPLMALIAAAALERWWRSSYSSLRLAAVASVLVAVFMFRGFYQDYMGDWRVRSAPYFGGNLKGALEAVMKSPRDKVPDTVYLSDHIPYVNVFWEFYRRADGRDDLRGRDRGLTLEHNDWQQPPGHALAIVPGGDDRSAAALKAAGWQVVEEIREFYGGAPTFFVMSRG